MDSNFQKCIFLAPFPLNSAHVLVAILVIEVSPMVLYPFLKLVGLNHYRRQGHFPRSERANNSGTTQVKISYRIAACRKIEGSLYA